MFGSVAGGSDNSFSGLHNTLVEETQEAKPKKKVGFELSIDSRSVEVVSIDQNDLCILQKVFYGIVEFIKKLVERVVSVLPYSARLVFQDCVDTSSDALTKTETQRMLGMKGDDGLFSCRLADGWSTAPAFSENGRLKIVTRAYLRLNNIAVFRGDSDSTDLSRAMIGPNHYLGVLDDTHKYTCKLANTENGILQFVSMGATPEQTLPSQPIQQKDVLMVDAAWVSGKHKDNRGEVQKNLKSNSGAKNQALTDDIGVLKFEGNRYVLPEVDGTKYDLSSFGAKLVKNDLPFKITKEKEDPLDVVTYHFGSEYAKTIVEKKDGLFLETHNFTQIMSPMTADSGGFITLGRWNEKGKLELIGVKVPYGYSIIIDKGAIHGDATFVGSYLMAMTVDHHTMGTADVLYLKGPNKENLSLELSSTKNIHATVPSAEHSGSKLPSKGYLDREIRPLVVVGEGAHKPEFDAKIREEKKSLDEVVLTGSAIVKNPINKAGHLMRKIK